MRRGFSLLELMIVLAIVAIVTALAVPSLGDIMDWVAADGAAHDVTTALAVARATAVSQSTLVRVEIGADSLRIDIRMDGVWGPYRSFSGPSARGVQLEVSNPEVVFGPSGLGWGTANSTITLRRGARVETVTTSRVGRVKRW
ncbi:MAG TPA: GspH/FimT family pseudopilin [Gemmatimonadales bacterium]|nr:GspH/FimT family pseudopilin [Gemmatimonadales bacterium]